MDDTENLTVGLTYGDAMHVDDLRKGQYFMPLAVEKDVLFRVGQIMASWGYFEQLMDNFTHEIVSQTSFPAPKKWKMKSFNERRKLSEKALLFCATKKAPEVCGLVKKVSQDAIAAYDVRCQLAHGLYRPGLEYCTGDMIGNNVPYVVEPARKGRGKSMLLEKESLKKTAIDISYLTGNLLFVLERLGGKIDGFVVNISASELLGHGVKGQFSPRPVSTFFDPK
ncbi:hypothetical protein [Primorskyibacter flagellatus]|uniref:Uncharacterized protein n=1 Tax=Primorskyibacter flagellatus TaxID=1387277 RepID=A0A1W2DYL7_9RHOB|nr:hypothetical protein [Primorskyibacter flagellatus]SMD02407.1 hypothetical protein SAMN06295998_11958 [Primorskyibacter flagellatus]